MNSSPQQFLRAQKRSVLARAHYREWFAPRRFLVLPAELMRRFVVFIARKLEQMNKPRNQIEKLRRTRGLLLPRLLSGQVSLGN